MAFEKVEVSTWTPKEKGEELIGILIRAEKDVGTNKSMLYNVEVDGKPMSAYDLDQKGVWQKLEINIIRRIRFKGKCMSGLKAVLR